MYVCDVADMRMHLRAAAWDRALDGDIERTDSREDESETHIGVLVIGDRG